MIFRTPQISTKMLFPKPLTTVTSEASIATMVAPRKPANQLPLHINITFEVKSIETFSWADFPLLRQYLVQIPTPSLPTLDGTKLRAKITSRKNRNLEERISICSKVVRFEYVTVREHAITVGEHDWCDGPLPLVLDWKHAEPRSFHINEYERIREHSKKMPSGRVPKLDYWQRKHRLHSVSGLTDRELTKYENGYSTSISFQLRRTKTVTQLPSSKEILREAQTPYFWRLEDDKYEDAYRQQDVLST